MQTEKLIQAILKCQSNTDESKLEVEAGRVVDALTEDNDSSFSSLDNSSFHSACSTQNETSLIDIDNMTVDGEMFSCDETVSI